MRKTRIAELKNRLSYYLDFVRRGESVLIYDSGHAIARIDPVMPSGAVESKEWTAELVRTGVLRPPKTLLGKDWLRRRPTVDDDVLDTLLTERDSGR